MNIKSHNDQRINFSNGDYIIYDHEQDCCERNYADFSILDTFYHGEEFDYVTISAADEGFLLNLHGVEPFASFGEPMKIFIPCYSVQNGYYTTHLVVSLCHENMERPLECICLHCEFVDECGDWDEYPEDDPCDECMEPCTEDCPHHW